MRDEVDYGSSKDASPFDFQEQLTSRFMLKYPGFQFFDQEREQVLGFIRCAKELANSNNKTFTELTSSKAAVFFDECRAQQLQNSVVRTRDGLKRKIVEQEKALVNPTDKTASPSRLTEEEFSESFCKAPELTAFNTLPIEELLELIKNEANSAMQANNEQVTQAIEEGLKNFHKAPSPSTPESTSGKAGSFSPRALCRKFLEAVDQEITEFQKKGEAEAEAYWKKLLSDQKERPCFLLPLVQQAVLRYPPQDFFCTAEVIKSFLNKSDFAKLPVTTEYTEEYIEECFSANHRSLVAEISRIFSQLNQAESYFKKVKAESSKLDSLWEKREFNLLKFNDQFKRYEDTVNECEALVAKLEANEPVVDLVRRLKEAREESEKQLTALKKLLETAQNTIEPEEIPLLPALTKEEQLPPEGVCPDLILRFDEEKQSLELNHKKFDELRKKVDSHNKLVTLTEELANNKDDLNSRISEEEVDAIAKQTVDITIDPSGKRLTEYEGLQPRVLEEFQDQCRDVRALCAQKKTEILKEEIEKYTNAKNDFENKTKKVEGITPQEFLAELKKLEAYHQAAIKRFKQSDHGPHYQDSTIHYALLKKEREKMQQLKEEVDNLIAQKIQAFCNNFTQDILGPLVQELNTQQSMIRLETRDACKAWKRNPNAIQLLKEVAFKYQEVASKYEEVASTVRTLAESPVPQASQTLEGLLKESLDLRDDLTQFCKQKRVEFLQERGKFTHATVEICDRVLHSLKALLFKLFTLGLCKPTDFKPPPLESAQQSCNDTQRRLTTLFTSCRVEAAVVASEGENPHSEHDSFSQRAGWVC